MDKIKFDWKDSDFNFHWRFGEFEICTVREEYSNGEYRYDNDSNINTTIPVELVKWNKEHTNCWVIALWRKMKGDTYELRFIGSRPFNDIEPYEIAEIWEQLKAAQNMLDAYAIAMRNY